MAGGGGEPNPAGRFVCAFCGAAWPSARSLANHAVVHANENARAAAPRRSRPPPPVQGRPAAERPRQRQRARGVSVTPTTVLETPQEMSTWLSLAPPSTPCACVLRRLKMLVPAPPVPVAGPRNTIPMTLLDPNPQFWVGYRLGCVSRSELEQVFFPEPRHESPSPSFRGWI